MVPIAHASNFGGEHQQKSFFATLCAANQVIQVQLDLPIKPDQTKSQANQSINKCPLCVVAEQSDSNINIVPAFKPLLDVPEQFDENYSTFYQPHSGKFSAIRAPPTIL